MLIAMKNAVVALLVLTLITGIAYPLAVTLIAQVVFPEKANGSLLTDGAGSMLICQPFDDPRYFWGRLSGCSHNAAASSGTNYAMSNPALIDAAKARIAALRAADPDNALPIPVDLVTASGSGLDPHITLEAARYQAPRIARTRGEPLEKVEAMIVAATESPAIGIAGSPCVNVVRLNLVLDGKLLMPSVADGRTVNRHAKAFWRGSAFLPE